MNSAGNNKKSVYLVVALFLVGLTAYSNAMKELADIHRLTLSAGQVIAQWSRTSITPAEAPQIPPAVVKLEACESMPPTPPLELPRLNHVQEATELKIERIERRVRVKPNADQVAKVKKLERFEFDAAGFAFKVSKNQFPEASEPFTYELPAMLRAKARKHNTIKFNPRDREMLLKTLNRSINLRVAS